MAPRGWQIAPAAEDSIRTGSQEGLGFLQTRYGRKSGGDTGLVMVRSANRPNAITREIKDLQPGKLYTFRMMTSDFKDMSNKENHAASVRLDNVTLMPERTITQLFPNPTWRGASALRRQYTPGVDCLSLVPLPGQ